MKTTLTLAGLALLVLSGALLIDRLLLAAEARGWIYYRKKRGHVDRLGQSALRLQALLEPGKRHEVVERERERRDSEGEGAPPAPGGEAR